MIPPLLPCLAGNRMNPPTSPEKPSWVKRLAAQCEAHWVELLLVIIGGTLASLFFSEWLFDFFTPKASELKQPNDYLTHLGHFRQGLLTLGGGLVGVLVAWRGYMNLQHQKEELAHDKGRC